MPDVVLSGESTFVELNPEEHHSQARALTTKYLGSKLDTLISEELADNELAPPFADASRDALLVSERLKIETPLLRDPQSILEEAVARILYRNKGGYLVGRLVVDGQLFLLAVAFCVNETGVFVDAVLWGDPRLSIIFSFTRTIFYG